MPRLLAFLFCVLAAAAQSPSKLGYGLIVTGGPFRVVTTGTNIPTVNGARVLTTNDLGSIGGVTGTPLYVESDPAFVAASNAFLQATGTASRVQLGQFVINTNKITLSYSATSFSLFAGEERGLGQGTVGAFITGYRTNSGTTPGTLSFGTPGVTGSVRISAAEFVSIENTRFDTDAISNSAGTIYMASVVAPTVTADYVRSVNFGALGVVSNISLLYATNVAVSNIYLTGQMQIRGSAAFGLPVMASVTNEIAVNDGQGQGIINKYRGRLDLRSYWAPPLMVFRLTTNTPASAQIAQSWWTYNETGSGDFPSNHGVYVTFGPHDATKANYHAAIGSSARGTNNGMGDLVFQTADATSNLNERARLTSEGNLVLSTGKFIGDGSALTGVAGGSNPFTNFYSAYVATPTNRVQFTVPTNDAWSRIEVRVKAYQTNDAAQGFVYFRINGATGTNVLYAYQYLVANHTTIQGTSGSNDATGAYSGRLHAPHNYSNAACDVTILLNDIFDPYPAKTYTSHNWTKLRTVGGVNQQYIEQNDGSVSIGGVVTGLEILAIGTVFDTGSVIRARGMP